MFVEFRASGATAGRQDFGHAEQQFLGNRADAVRFSQRSAGRGEKVDGGSAFIEVREEELAHPRIERERTGHQEEGENDDDPGMAHGRPQDEACVETFQAAHQPAVFFVPHAFHLRQQIGGQRRDDGERHDERGDHGHDGRDPDGSEEPAFNAAEGEERDENQDDYESRIKDGIPHLRGRVGDHAQKRPRLGRVPVLAQAAIDVFHVDDRVVHDHADGDGEAAEGHRIDADAGELEIEAGDNEGERDRGERDRGRAEIQQEKEQHDDHHDGTVADGLLDVGDGRLDEVGLLEQLEYLHVGRQGLADVHERGLDLARERDRINSGLFLHGEDDGGLAVDPGVTAHDLLAESDLRHVVKVHRNALADRHHGIGDVVERSGAADIADEGLLVGAFQKPAGGVVLGFLGRGDDLIEAHPEGGELLGDREHLVLLHAAANRDHLRNARDREQPLAHGPVGERADVHGRGGAGFALQADEHDLAHDRADRPHRGGDAAGELVRRELQTLLHELAGAVDVHAPVELDEKNGKPDAGIGADAFHAGRAVERGLHREVHERLDFLRSEAWRLGQDRDSRPVQIREDVHRQLQDDEAAVEEEEGAGRQHEEPVAQRESDEVVEHGNAGRRLLPGRRLRGISSGLPGIISRRLRRCRCNVLQLIIANRDDVGAGEHALDNLDVAVVALADHDRRAHVGVRILLILHEDEKVPRLAEDGGKGHGDDGVGLGGHDRQRGAHVGQEFSLRVGHADAHAEGAGARIKLRQVAFDGAGENDGGIRLGAHPHFLADLHLGDLAFVDAGDDVERRQIGDFQQMGVRFDAVTRERVPVENCAPERGVERDVGRRIADLPALDLEQKISLGHGVALLDGEPHDTAGNAARQRGDARGIDLDIAEGRERFLQRAQFGGLEFEPEVFFGFGCEFDRTSERAGVVFTRRLVVTSVGKHAGGRLGKESDKSDEDEQTFHKRENAGAWIRRGAAMLRAGHQRAVR